MVQKKSPLYQQGKGTKAIMKKEIRENRHREGLETKKKKTMK